MNEIVLYAYSPLPDFEEALEVARRRSQAPNNETNCMRCTVELVKTTARYCWDANHTEYEHTFKYTEE